MSKDLFADLLTSNKSASNSSTNSFKNEKKLSMNERLNSNSTSTLNSVSNANGGGVKNSNNWIDQLDLLDTLSSNSKNSSSQNISTSNVLTNNQPKSNNNGTNKTDNNDDIEALFDVFNNKKQPVQQPVQQYQPQQSALNGENSLLDGMDFFTSPSTKIDNSPEPEPVPLSIPESVTLQEQTPVQSNQDKKDEILAELIDMGFSIDKANEALDNRDNTDLNEAISYLMNDAHKKTNTRRPQQTRQSNNYDHEDESEYSGYSNISSRRQNGGSNLNSDDVSAMVNELSTDLMNKASFLFKTGQKYLNQGIDKYKQQKFEKNNNLPLWMKNQAIHKEKSIPLPEDEYDDYNNMTEEEMRNIVEAQKLRELKLKKEKSQYQKQKALEKQQQQQQQRRQQQQQQYQEQQDQDVLFDRPTNSSSVPLTRQQSERNTPIQSRPSTPNQQTNTQPQSRPADEALFDMLNSKPQPSQPQSRLDKLRNSKSEDEPMYVPSSRRRTTRSNTPASSSPSPSPSLEKLIIPSISISDIQLTNFKNARERGNEFFKNGDFPVALTSYEDSLKSLPNGHIFSIISYSNLSIVYSKLGNSKSQLEFSEKGLMILNKICKNNYNLLNNEFIENDKTFKSFWIKLLSKKSEALENLEKFKDAFFNYNLLIENGGSSKPIMDGKNRCFKILNPEKSKTTTSSTPSRARQQQQPIRSTSKPTGNGEATRRIKEQNQKTENFENEKFQLHDQIEDKLNTWRNGKEDNLRALLSSLHLILWKETNWKPVGLTDLVLDKKVKIIYMKAVAKTHPDKISTNATTEQKLIAQGVFVTLNQAWDKFKTMNNIQ
ncbi:hypothetical protein B5S28_g2972 [[Candida] boidinii]|nr:hypothetical protein B5S28_g2972 [[Candida] boidinii]OWB62605.1 hypothetical protein B5S29_g3540 [[Candida] boidinii]OWB75468.1 hypothetical protein B5S31_g5373 [[Candida] boidinii]